MSGAERLYTPEMLSAAVELAGWPLRDSFKYRGEARAPSCGSNLAIGFDCDERRAVTAIGLQARACAVGQASAAIFARHVKGLTLEDIARAHDDVVNWLSHDNDADEAGGEAQNPLPNWPDFVLIAAAKDYPGRHGAILLPWKAAISALSKVDEPS